MTNEEKELLVRDLSARLLYGVKIVHYFPSGDNKSLLSIEGTLEGISSRSVLLDVGTFPIFENSGKYSLPYLRSMSSMTKDEAEEFEKVTKVFEYYPGHVMYDEVPVFDNRRREFDTFATERSYKCVLPENIISCIDWLLKKHFDFRGLITLGLALEAPKDMYK